MVVREVWRSVSLLTKAVSLPLCPVVCILSQLVRDASGEIVTITSNITSSSITSPITSPIINHIATPNPRPPRVFAPRHSLRHTCLFSIHAYLFAPRHCATPAVSISHAHPTLILAFSAPHCGVIKILFSLLVSSHLIGSKKRGGFYLFVQLPISYRICPYLTPSSPYFINNCFYDS